MKKKSPRLVSLNIALNITYLHTTNMRGMLNTFTGGTCMASSIMVVLVNVDQSLKFLLMADFPTHFVWQSAKIIQNLYQRYSSESLQNAITGVKNLWGTAKHVKQNDVP